MTYEPEDVDWVNDYNYAQTYPANEGRSYQTGYYWSTFTASSTKSILVRNPSGSGKNVFVTDSATSTDGPYVARMYKNETVSSDGTAVNVVNLASDRADNPSYVEAFRGPTRSGGTQYPPVYTGGEKNKVVAKSDGPTQLLEEGSWTTIEMENVSGNDLGGASIMVHLTVHDDV